MPSVYKRLGLLILASIFLLPSAIAAPLHDAAWAADIEQGCRKESRVICLTRTSSWHKEGGKVTTKAWVEGQEERDDYTFLLNENNELKIISEDGEIIILSGRVMLAKDVPLMKGYEIDWADAVTIRNLVVHTREYVRVRFDRLGDKVRYRVKELSNMESCETETGRARLQQ